MLGPATSCCTCRYNDLVLAGSAVAGNGTAALAGANDAVTRRYQQAAHAGLNVVRLFASEGVNGALETAPGVHHVFVRTRD